MVGGKAVAVGYFIDGLAGDGDVLNMLRPDSGDGTVLLSNARTADGLDVGGCRGHILKDCIRPFLSENGHKKGRSKMNALKEM